MQLMTTPYQRLRIRLPLSSKPHQTRSSKSMLDLKAVEILPRITMITSCYLFNKRIMSSVQKFLSRNLIFLIICNLCLYVHLINYSTYTPHNIQITTFFYSRTRMQTTILQSDSFIHLIIQYLLRYHHTRIALRRISKILLKRRLVFVAGLALFTVPRYAGFIHRDNIERLEAAWYERAFRRISTLLAIRSAFLSRKLTPFTAPVAPCAAPST